jgi:hypothetical protein
MNLPKRVGFALAVLVIGAMAVFAMLAGCGDRAHNHRPDMQEELYRAAEAAGPGGSIRLGEAFPEAWDTVVIWDGYYAELGGPTEFGPEVVFGEGAHGEAAVIALGLDGRLVAWDRIDLDRPDIYVAFDFTTPGEIRAPRERAVFEVVTDNGWLGEGLALRLADATP